MASGILRFLRVLPFIVLGASPALAKDVAIAMATAAIHSCAVLNTGKVKCWGDNQVGQLGNGTTTSSLKPVAVANLTGVTAITAGRWHTCALLKLYGQVKCWGYGSYGQLGGGTAMYFSSKPLLVKNLTNVTAISAGLYFTCARLKNGAVKCWGSNATGQIGDGTLTDRPAPVAVKGLINVPIVATAIGTGFYHGCARLNNGSVKCWGHNSSKQLGDGTTTESSPPVVVKTLTGAAGVSGGINQTCSRLDSGSVKCWGDGRARPVGVKGLTGTTTLTLGNMHGCSVIKSGQIKCWGSNTHGQLGDGTLAGRVTPVFVKNLTDAKTVASEMYHTCAVLKTGRVLCWGQNDRGQLGDNTTQERLTAVGVFGF